MADSSDLLKVYERLGSVDSKLEALIARSDVQFLHGAKKMDDLEQQVRSIKAALPVRVDERLTDLEKWRWRRDGAAALWGVISGGGTATLLTYLLSHH